MRKIKKSLVALLLLVSVIFSFASCNLIDGVNDFLDRNADGPGTTEEDLYEACWIETYEEMLVVVEKLKANGTEVPIIPAFDCEEYGLDIKFQFIISKHLLKNLEDGQEFYDTKISNLNVKCVVFLEDVTIKTLKSYGLGIYNKCLLVNKIQGVDPEPPTSAAVVNIQPSATVEGRFSVNYNRKAQFALQRGYIEFDLTEEQIEILKKTVAIIE